MLAHLSVLSNTGRVIGTVSFFLMTSSLVRIFIRIVSLYGYRSFVFRCLTDGEGVAYGGLPFPGTGCPAPDFGNICLVWNYWYMGYCFCISPPPCDVSVHVLSFWKNGFDELPWISFLSDLHIEISIVSGVFQALQLALLAVFGTVDEPLTSLVVVHF